MNLPKKLVAGCMAAGLAAAISGSAIGAQYSPPHAHLYSFRYPSDSVGKSLFTQQSADEAKTPLGNAGYDVYDSVHKSASTSLNSGNAQSDAVWAFFGHARAGGLLFWDTTGYSELLANSNLTPLKWGWDKAILANTNGLVDLRLMVFAACNTADDSVPDGRYDGNLLDEAMGRGVDSAIGFRDLIYWPAVDYWSDEFFKSLKRGHTVDEAAVNAQGYVLYALGLNYFGTDDWSSRRGWLKITPAGYGS